MSWAVVAAVAPTVVGGLMGGQESSQSQTQKQELDPRMQALLYGSGGNPGLLGDTDNLRKQQLAQGGLNDMQRSGLEMQRQTLMSPQYTQGFDMMRQQGASLMGAGVAGNPFANGGNGSIPMGGGRMGGMGQGAPMAAPSMPQQPMQPFQYDQQALQSSLNPMQAAAPAQAPAAPEKSPLDDYLQQLYNDNQSWLRTDGPGTRNYGGGR